MLVQQRSLLVIARVVEAGSVRREGHALIARGGQFVLQRLAGLYVQQVDFGLVRSALPYRIGHERPIAGDILDEYRGIRIPAQLGGIDQPLVLSRPAVAHVNRELLLAGQPFSEEVALGASQGRPRGRDVLQRVQIVHRLLADARLLQIALRIGVLRVDEGPRLGAFGVFQPAVAVGNLGPEVVVGNGNRLDGGRRRQGNPLASVNRLG